MVIWQFLSDSIGLELWLGNQNLATFMKDQTRVDMYMYLLKAISIKSSYRKCILLLQQDSDRGVKYGIWQKKITTTTAKPSTTTLYYYYFITLKFYAEMSYNNALRKSLSVIGMHRIF